MKKLFFLPLIIFFLYSHAQNNNSLYRIEYDVFYNTESPNTRNAFLIVDIINQKSIFIEKTIKEERLAKLDSTKNRVIIKSTSNNNPYNFSDFKENRIESLVNIHFDDYLLIEKIPNFNWIILDSVKIINGEKLKMAKANFRGRNYIAWYNENYPIKFGPWKFNGLPGLIYYIYDETKRYNWTIKNIKKIDDTTDFFSNLKKDNKITLREYADLRYDVSKFEKQLKSRLPRGSEVSKKTESKRNGIEIEFEWEK